MCSSSNCDNTSVLGSPDNTEILAEGKVGATPKVDEVLKEVDLGSHTLFICEPTFMDVLSDTQSCTYEFYQSDIKPKPQPVPEPPKKQGFFARLFARFKKKS